VERTIKSLVLIRAKHLAESVTTPMLLADGEGNMIFYNEAAEAVLGTAFSDLGPIPASQWQEQFKVRGRGDAPFPLESMPGWMDVKSERPGLGHVKFTSLHGDDHFIAVCAFPLFTAQRQFDGALVIFWEEDE
jgi:PAS domain-containing protein